jgi:hypothetical protein
LLSFTFIPTALTASELLKQSPKDHGDSEWITKGNTSMSANCLLVTSPLIRTSQGLCGQKRSKASTVIKVHGAACNTGSDPAGITDDFTISHYARDMEYGYEILVENLIDPAHVPFSHSGVGGITRKSVRIGDASGVSHVQTWI